MVRLPDVSAGELKRSTPCLIVALSVLFSRRGSPSLTIPRPGRSSIPKNVSISELGDAFGGKVLVYALDSGPLGGVVVGVMGLLSAILSGLLLYGG